MNSSNIPLSKLVAKEHHLSLWEKQQQLVESFLVYPDKTKEIIERERELIDFQLITLVETKAQKLKQNHSETAASFLENLAAQLKKVKVNPNNLDVQKDACETAYGRWVQR